MSLKRWGGPRTPDLAEPRPRLLLGRVGLSPGEAPDASPVLSCCWHCFCPIIFTIATIYLHPY